MLTLLLGLAIAELLTGLGRSWRLEVGATRTSHQSIHIGKLVPMLALMLLFDQAHFWVTAYTLKQFFLFDYLLLLGVIFVIGGYYVIASFVFPDEPDQWPDFDEYYDASKRVVVGGVILANLTTVFFGLGWAVWRSVDVTSAPLMRSSLSVAVAVGYFACLAALWLVKSRRANLLLLIAANILLVTVAIAERFGASLTYIDLSRYFP